MNGWLIVNEFVLSDKFNELFMMLYQSADAAGIRLIKKTNSEVWTMLASCNFKLREFFGDGCTFVKDGVEIVVSAKDIDLERPDFILFWDKDTRLAFELERQGMRLFNRAQAIADCDDKAVTFMKLNAAGIRQPETFVAPKKFHADGILDSRFINLASNRLGFPCVVKECFGSFGAQVYLANNRQELEELVKSIGDRPYIIQEFIEYSRGRDVRIQVVGGKVIAAMKRSNMKGDFRSNLTNGGTMAPFQPSNEMISFAVQACEALNLDFAGVDILIGPGESAYVSEVNSNAHFKNLKDCTRVNAADHIIAYIKARLS